MKTALTGHEIKEKVRTNLQKMTSKPLPIN